MATIVLTTFNARYSHASLGLRYMRAQLAERGHESRILEFDLHTRLDAAAQRIAVEQPRIIGIGVYIWNATLVAQWMPTLRRCCPETTIILGGPEVVDEIDPALIAAADHVISGEGECLFAEVCEQILAGNHPAARRLEAPPPDLAQLTLPYAEYTDDDIAHRTLYVETTRGCLFRCQYCLSSRDQGLRYFPTQTLRAALEHLAARGARQFKFVDRAFNANPTWCLDWFRYFLTQFAGRVFMHFEMQPDRFTKELQDLLRQFPRGSLQFEIGIQTWNPTVAERIERRQDVQAAEAHLRFLRESTHVYLHTDLIAGLPGEDLATFADGFDRLLSLRPHEIQVGILKRLRGTTIGRHDAEWGMEYDPAPPYTLRRNRLLDAATMQRLGRFADYWDRVANDGRFIRTAPLLWEKAVSPFQAFMDFSDWLYARHQAVHGITLDQLAESLFMYLTRQRGYAEDMIVCAMTNDFAAAGPRHLPVFLKIRWPEDQARPVIPPVPVLAPCLTRQQRHWTAERMSAAGPSAG